MSAKDRDIGKARAREDARNERHLTRQAENRVRLEERALAARRVRAVGPWDDTPPKWDWDFDGCRA